MKSNWNSTAVLSWTLALVLAGAAAVRAQDAAGQGSPASGTPETTATEAAKAPEPRPQVTVDEPIADVGKVVKGETVRHEFIVRNTGTAPLEIREVRPACGCTVVEFDKTIAPGASGKVTASLDTSGLASGGGSKAISLFTNDPETPRVQLTMQASVLEYLVFNPGFARFVKGKGNTPGVVENIFYTPRFDGLEITGVESPFPYLDIQYREATDEERRPEGKVPQYVLTLTLDYNKAPVGPMTGEVAVHTNHPKQKTAWLKVSGFVRPLLAVTPPAANYGDIDQPERMTTNFLVKNFAPFAVQVTKVEEDIEGAEAKVTALEAGKVYNVELKFDPKMPKGAFRGVLKIYTDSKEQPVVEVPLTGTVL
jgi:hypothetical protein